MPQSYTANLTSDLDNLLSDLHSTKAMVREVDTSHKLNTHGETGVDRSSSGQVSKLISDMEQGLSHTSEPVQPVRTYPPPGGVPITETVYYEESTTHEVRPGAAKSSPRRAVMEPARRAVVEPARRAVMEPTRSGRVASNRELDNLMSSLSDLKVEEEVRTVSPRPDPPHSFRSTPIPRGTCYFCKEPIIGQVVTALAKTWHMDHFTCVHCGTQLAKTSFFEKDGEPYCETDYHQLFSPRCAYCSAPIIDVCVSFEKIFPLKNISFEKIFPSILTPFFLSRNVFQLWTKHGIQSISSVVNAESNLERKDIMKWMGKRTAETATSIHSLLSVPVATKPSPTISFPLLTHSGILTVLFAG